MMRVWKQWIDEHRTTRKTDNGRWKVTKACDDRHLLRMAVNDHTASSRLLAVRWSIAAGVLMTASSISRRLLHRGLRARVPLYRIPLTASLELSSRKIMQAHALQRLFLTCSAQRMHFLLWPAYSPDMSPNVHAWDLVGNLVALYFKYDFWHRTATAGSDVVQSGRPIFDDLFQHLWPYIGNNTANVVFQMVKRLWLIRIDQ
ncbi:transposable element Tcb2 transposase [Trichonephila clavipes]|nr:transposable element Tcb2 transposase [Trichonephila clavipes]